MKLRIENYEIEIKARDIRDKERMNKEDTGLFLSIISRICYKAEYAYKENNLNGLAKQASKIAEDIFDALNKEGYFTK